MATQVSKKKRLSYQIPLFALRETEFLSVIGNTGALLASCLLPDNDKRIRVVYTLSEALEGWQGEEGYIHAQMIDRHVTKPNGLKHKVRLSDIYSIPFW